MRARFHDGGGSYGGDPRRFAQALITLAGMEQPPLRIPFGSDAVTILRAAAEADIASIDRWRELSESTDFEGTAAFDVSALPGV
jgi:hypothetical protein